MKRNITNPKARKGQDRFNRALSLMEKLTPMSESVNKAALEHIKKGSDGKLYGIVRENQKYYIKTTDYKDNVIVEDFNYIGGLKNKMSESYDSYAAALKHLNFKFNLLNEYNDVKSNINLFESDMTLVDEEKFVLKTPKTSVSAPEVPEEEEVAPPPAEDDMDFGDPEDPAPPSDDAPDEAPEGDEEGDDEDFGDEEDGEEDIQGEVQTLTGELGQKLRDFFDERGFDEKIEKYVGNSIASALHFNKWDKKDKKEFIGKLKDKDEDTEAPESPDMDEPEMDEPDMDAPEKGDKEEEVTEESFFAKTNILDMGDDEEKEYVLEFEVPEKEYVLEFDVNEVMFGDDYEVDMSEDYNMEGDTYGDADDLLLGRDSMGMSHPRELSGEEDGIVRRRYRTTEPDADMGPYINQGGDEYSYMDDFAHDIHYGDSKPTITPHTAPPIPEEDDDYAYDPGQEKGEPRQGSMHDVDFHHQHELKSLRRNRSDYGGYA